MYSFSKEERLCNRRLIDGLYRNGSSFLLYPIRVQWQRTNGKTGNSQVLFSVPKRTFKSAVTRNLLKRLMRESYRLNRKQAFSAHPLLTENLLIGFHYVAKTPLSFELIQKKMILVLEKLIDEISNGHDECH